MSYCDHNHKRIFIASETGPDGRRAHANICSECGMIFVWIDGEQLGFWLVSDEQVEAASKYAKHLKEQEDNDKEST